MNMINWPIDTQYIDTGEGGLFAIATWEGVRKECMVMTNPSIEVNDTRVASHGPDAGLFEEQAREIAQRSNYWSEDYDEVRYEFDTVIFLGSISESFFNETTQEYFAVTKEDLTMKGFEIIRTLESVYGSPVTITTFLDT